MSTTVELPIYKTSSADTQGSDATDACGIFYDTQGTTDTWTVGGVKSDVDVTPVCHATLLPVAATYVTLRVEVSAAGAVTGYVDGTLIGTVAAAVTATVALTPVIVVSNRVTPVCHATLLPVAATYVTLRVEVSAAGAVTGYVDGTLIGTVAAAVTATVALRRSSS